MKVFLDANIFIAAAGSPHGGFSFVLEFAKKRTFSTVTVTHALVEAERNIRNKMSKAALERHHANLLALHHTIEPLPDLNAHMYAAIEHLVPPKDIPILLGALISRSDFLITLDKQDFLENERLQSTQLPLHILSPGSFLEILIG